MSTEITLGKLVTGNPERDAVHIAVIPLIAGESLGSGTRVRLSSTSMEIAMSADYRDDKAIGIVDPFYEDNYGEVREGEKFWCFIFPNTVTGMTHRWQHPAFTEFKEIEGEHKRWIVDFADRWHFDYEDLIETAISSRYDRYIVAHGRDLHGAWELGEDHDLFWFHLEGLTGEKYSEAHRAGMGWSCSC